MVFIEALFSAIGNLVTAMGGNIVDPIYAILVSVFPDFAIYIDVVLSFVGYIVQFVPLVIQISMIPRPVFILIMSYTLTKTGIYYSLLIYRFILNLYNKLKP